MFAVRAEFGISKIPQTIQHGSTFRVTQICFWCRPFTLSRQLNKASKKQHDPKASVNASEHPKAHFSNDPISKQSKSKSSVGLHAAVAPHLHSRPGTADPSSNSCLRICRVELIQVVYPERLLVYHAGTGRTVFVASTRLLGIFIFIFASLWIAPSYFFSPFEPTWMAPVVVFGGAVPLLVSAFTTAPLVTYAHLTLPHWARTSAARLHRFAESLPSSSTIDLTTLRWIWPRVTRLRASELFIHKGEIIGAMTLRRQVPTVVLDQRRWWMWRPLSKFYVAGKSNGQVAEEGLWPSILSCVSRGWEQRNPRGKLLIKQK